MASPLIGPSVLVTGANRGLGLVLIRELVKQTGITHIFAGCRDPDAAKDLHAIAATNDILHIVQLDVADDESIHSAAEIVQGKLNGAGLNVLINNAGILTPGDVAGYRKPNRKSLLDHFNINSVSPVVVTGIFLPLLRKDSSEERPSLVLNISSQFGSVEKALELGICFDNVVYSMTKAAVNMYTRCLALAEGPNHVVSVALHPGWLATDMGTAEAPETPEQGAADIVKLLPRLQDHSFNGHFIDRFGVDLPF